MSEGPATGAALPVPAEEVQAQPAAAEPTSRTLEAPLATVKFDDSEYGCCNGNGSSPGCTGSTKGCVASALNPILSLCNGGVTPLATPGSGILTAVSRYGEKVQAASKDQDKYYSSTSSFVSQWRREQARMHASAAGKALAVHAVGLTSTIADPYVQRPMLRLTVVDESTGMPLRRPLWLPAGGASASLIPLQGGSFTGPSVLGGTMSAPLGGMPGMCSGKPNGNTFVPNMHSRRSPVALDITPPQATAPTAVTVPAGGAAAPASTPADKPKGVTEVPAVWDETLVLPDDARVYLRPGVVFLFEVLEWGMQIPPRLLQRSAVPGMPHTGVYPVSWGFFRPVAADGACKVHVSPPLLIPPPGTAAAGGAHTTRRRSAATGSAGVHQRSQLNPTMELLSLSNGIPQLLTREEVASMGGLVEEAPPHKPDETGDSKEGDTTQPRPSAKHSAPVQTLAHFGLGLAFARPVRVTVTAGAAGQKEEGGPDPAEGGGSDEELPAPGRNARQATIPVPAGSDAEQLQQVFEVARPPLLRVKMYRWQQATWQAAAAHNASMRSAVLLSARALDRLRRKREDPTHSSGPDSGMLGAAPPPVCLQYRLRGRQEAGYTLGVQVAAIQPWWMGAGATTGGSAATPPQAAHEAAGVVDDWAASQAAARAEEAAWSNGRFHVSALDRDSSLRGAAAGEELGGGPGGRNGDPTAAGAGAGREDLASLALRQRRQRDPCLPPVRHFGTLSAGQLGAMAVSFSPKGEYVAVGASDAGDNHPIRLYDTDTGKLLAVLAGHTGLVYALRWRGDGRMLATASADGTARVWQIIAAAEGGEMGERSRNSGRSGSNSRRNSLDTAATAEGGGGGRVLAPALVATLTHRPMVFVYSAAWHPKDPSVLVTGAFDGKVRLWTFQPLEEADGGSGASGSDSEEEPQDRRGRGGRRARDGRATADTGDSSSDEEGRGGAAVPGGKRRLQRTSSSMQMRQAEERGVFLGALGTDWTGAMGRRRRGGDEEGAGGVPLSPATRHVKGTSPQGPHGAHVNAVVFDAKGRRMYTADAGGAVVVWEVDERNGGDSASYSVRRRVVLPGLSGVPIVAMALHPTLSQLAVLAHGNTLRLLDAAYTTLPLVRTFPGVRCSTARLNVVFSPDGRYIAAGSEDGEVGIWETESGLVVEGAGQAGGARSMYIMGFGTQDGTALNDVDWHPSQHMVALSAFGRGNPVMLYVNDAEAGRS